MSRKIDLILLVLAYLLAWGLVARAQEEPAPPPQKLTPIGSITLLSSYSKLMGKDDLSGIYAAANFAPVVTLSPRDYLIPLYNGCFRRQRQIVAEEEGGRLYTTLMNHNFSLMYKHRYTQLATQRLSGFASLNYNKETADESFGEGLYDWRDYGVSGDYQYDLIKSERVTGTLLLGTKYFFRKYPNFKSLISLTSNNAPEENEKDQNCWGLNARYTHKVAEQATLAFAYEFLFKHFVDKYTVDENGILETGKRKDDVHYFKGNGEYRLGQRFILGLDGQIELNHSNQNYYDTNNTVGVLGDDVFVPHYFNYHRYEISPSLTWLLPVKETKNLVVKIVYAYAIQDYANRNIKNAAGIYQVEQQEDQSHGASVNIDFPFTNKLSFLINADYSHNLSNMEDERYYRYDYDLFHILCGLSYKF